MSVEEATKDSPLLQGRYTHEKVPQKYYNLTSSVFTASGMTASRNVPTEQQVKDVIDALDEKGRWLTKHAQTSNPYIGDGTKTEPTDKYASTHVGDETDTSQYRDESDQEYITTRAYINNMRVLMNYVSSLK